MKKNKKVFENRLFFSGLDSLLYIQQNKETEKTENQNINQDRISRQFCGFCTRVLKNEMYDIKKEHARECSRRKSMERVAAKEYVRISKMDKYFNDAHIFNVLDKEIVVFGDFLAVAIKQLPPEKQEVILMSYFLGMTDKEIGRRLNLIQQTVFKRRKTALKLLNDLLKDEVFKDE